MTSIITACTTCVPALHHVCHPTRSSQPPHNAAGIVIPNYMALLASHVCETARLAFKHRPLDSASPLPVLPFQVLDLSVLFPHLR